MKKIILICSGFTYLLFIVFQNSANLQLFIIGRWISDNSQINIEFLPYKIFFSDIKTSEDDSGFLFLSYEFLSNDQISISGRLMDKIQVMKKGHDLIIIESAHGFPPLGRYKRQVSLIEYSFLAVIFANILLLFAKKIFPKEKPH